MADPSEHQSIDSDVLAKVIPLTQSSDRKQAKLFGEILRSEVAEMREKVAEAEEQWAQRCESDGYCDPPERLLVVRERLGEIERMLDALSLRFRRAPKSA